MKKGYTIIELVLVIGLIAILSTFSINRFVDFQKQAQINAAADEFASTLKTARNKSINGEIGEGENVSDFEENGLPYFGIETSGNTYSLFREYLLKGSPTITKEILETKTLDSSFSFSGSSSVTFPRNSASSSPAEFNLSKTGLSEQKVIKIDNQGAVTVENKV